ncbi:MAG TPA: DUF3142 domain-containing protein [Candidatus Binataceae bacterium]|nr:DUF3142 domain-containing protein [Candidatus Binataceae bacterium]
MRWSRAKCFLFSLLLLPLLAALPSTKHRNTQFPNDAYIWQHRWTPAVTDAIAQSSDLLRDWRVLLAEVDRSGQWSKANIDWEALKRTKRPVILVIRIDGQLAHLDENAVLDRLIALIDSSEKSGVALAGIEIDHDCATIRLSAYANFLAALRRDLPPSTPLAITALPTWLGSDSVDEVFRQVDEIELQIHAVRDPKLGLFDGPQALRWIDTLSRRSSKPFRVALPNYGSRISWRSDGSLLAIEAETPLLAGGDSSTELMASPTDVGSLVLDLEANPPAHLAGFVWFRLPTRDDERAWSIETWRSVMRGSPSNGAIDVRIRPSGTAGMNLLVLANNGDLDTDLPRQIALPEQCQIGDGANGYSTVSDYPNLTLRRGEAGLLRGHQERVIGWARCAPATGEIHVQP